MPEKYSPADYGDYADLNEKNLLNPLNLREHFHTITDSDKSQSETTKKYSPADYGDYADPNKKICTIRSICGSHLHNKEESLCLIRLPQ